MPFTRPCFKRHLHAMRPPAGAPQSSEPQRTVTFHYGHERGLALENLDNTQLLLLSMLDGQHTFEQIMGHLQQNDPGVLAEDVNEVLEDLLQYGLIEDASVLPPADLTPGDLDRFESQLRLLSELDTSGIRKYELQATLKRARLTVLGLGGLGSNVLLGLAAIGIGYLRGVDFDVVETSNLNRQVLYDVNDIGKPKVVAAAEHIGQFNPVVNFEPVQRQIICQDDIIALIQETDLVAFCADLPGNINVWMNQAALQTGIPFIPGGYRGTAAEVGPFVLPHQTGCLGCLYAGRDITDDAIPELAWINDATWLRHPNIHFVTALAANLICSEIFKFVTKLSEPATYNHRFTLDVEQFTLTSTAWGRSEECSACGQRTAALRSADMPSI